MSDISPLPRQVDAAGLPVSVPHNGAVVLRVAGREYSPKRVAECKTCQSPFRTQIEALLLESYGYEGVLRQLPDDCGLTAANISEHVKRKHTTGSSVAWRQIIEDRAQEMGRSIEHDGSIVADHITLARLVVQTALERMAAGEMEMPSWSDVKGFASLLVQYDAQAAEHADTQAMTEAWVLFWEALAQEGSDVEQRITRRISGNPIMQALMKKLAISAGSTLIE